MIARLLFAALCVAPSLAHAQDVAPQATVADDAPVVAAPPPASPGIAPGEQIEWRVDYLGVKTGHARMHLGKPEGDIWPVIAQAKTEGVAKVLDIREHFVSYWNATDQRSGGSDLEAMEIGDHVREKHRFDRAQGKATITKWRNGRERNKVVAVPADVHDLASAMMWLRMQPLDVGSRYELPVFTGSETFVLRAVVHGVESVKTGIGTFEALRVDVMLGFKKKFETNRASHVWFSNDQRHIPLKMSADFAVGSVVATATAYTPGGQVAAR